MNFPKIGNLQFRRVAGTNKYIVSDDGQVWGFFEDTWETLEPYVRDDGRLCVWLNENGGKSVPLTEFKKLLSDENYAVQTCWED